MKRVLVVDDEDTMRESIVQVLRMSEYIVDEAANGLEALQRLASFIPDLIISDVSMPKLDGFGLLKELRKSERTSDIPFIFLTGQADHSSQREGMLLGADDYITKPFNQDDLIKAVELRLNKYEMMLNKIQKRLDEFLKSMNLALPHEFRTPLTGILGFAEILEQEQGLSPEETVHIGSQIHKSARRLHKLVERILLLAELDSDLASPERLNTLRSSSSAVGFAIGQTIETLGLDTQRMDDIHVFLVEARIGVLETHLLRTIEEIVSNALKFSSKGSEVKVSTSVDGSFVTITVQDCGRGMSEAQVKSIGAFVQFDRSHYEQQGPGIGLAIVTRICDLYGGSLNIDNSSPPGTKVSVSFPIAK